MAFAIFSKDAASTCGRVRDINAMTHPTTQDQWRKKLVRMLPRDVLESMVESPSYNRNNLDDQVMNALTDEGVVELLAILRKKVMP